MEHDQLIQCLNELCEQYEFLAITAFDKTTTGEMIPMISLGDGEKSVLYIGDSLETEMNTPIQTANSFLCFIREFCKLKRGNSSVYHYNVEYLFRHYTIHILPMITNEAHFFGKVSNFLNYNQMIGGILSFARTKSVLLESRQKTNLFFKTVICEIEKNHVSADSFEQYIWMRECLFSFAARLPWQKINPNGLA